MKNDFQLDEVKNKGPEGKVFIYLYIWGLMLSLFNPAPVWGQHYNFKTFTMEEGLGAAVVNTIFQDKKGCLWIGTYGGGLDRYDGASFTNYSTKNGLSDNSVFCIMGDRKGNLWIGTANGLTKYDGRHFTGYTTEDGLGGNFIWKIVEDRYGHLWVATDTNGVSRFDGTGFTNFTTDQGLIDNEVRSIAEDRNGNIWIGTLKGAGKYNGITFTDDAVTQRLKGHCIQTIMEDCWGNLWFGTRENGVLLVDIKTLTFTQYTKREGLCGNDVFDIMQDSSDHFWFSTYWGTSKFDGRWFTNYTTKQGLKHNLTNCTLEDREGNFWFGTALGLSRFRSENVTYFNEKDGLKCNFVWSIWEDPNGIIWFGTEEGIAKYDRKNDKITTAGGNYGSLNASPFYEDSKGHLWFGTREAIIKYDGQSFINFSKKTGMGIVNVFCIIEDRRGYMWFGTELGGVKVWDGKTVKSFTKENGLPHNFVNTLLEDTQGNIWAGTEKGLSRYNGTNFTPVSFAGDLNTRSTMCMKEDSKKNVWIGTFGGGIVRFMPDKNGTPAPGSFTAFTTEDGLLDDEILSMVFDNDGNLWIASKRGISVLDAAEFNQTGRKKFKYYDKDNGFTGIEPNDNAVYKDKEGNIWFGTLNGAIKFNPKKDKPNTVKPAVFITGLKLFLEEVNWSTRSKKPLDEFGLPKGLELSHLQNHLMFEFVGICLTVPEKVRYRVKLEGFDERWSPVSRATYATYSNLPPGEYVFKVRACNNEGLWNEEPAAYRFRITPPYWQTWWFYVLVFIAGSGILYSFIWLRIQTLKKQKQVLEEQVHSRTLELEEEKTKVEQINRELEQRVDERTRKLAIANEKLLHAQKMEALGTLAGGVAHDLNNILAGIVTYPDFLLTELPEDSPLISYVLAIQQSGQKAAAIVNDLLSLAKRRAKTMKVVNLNRVISDFTQSPELEKIMTKKPDVQMETHLKKELPNIMGSPVHLSKALMNLVSNAVEAMPRGGNIDITTKNQYVDPHRDTDESRELKAGEYAMVIVSDTGMGMSEQEVKRIFEPFYSKKNGGGTGLGLAVVWGTVQDHKGFITVQSQQGRGTVFTLYFPTTHQKLLEEKPTAAINELMGNGESILVVDDIKQQREVASLILIKLGYVVNTAASGEDAIEYLKEHPADLLMLDMIMEQGISGLETYKRALQMYPHQKAILVSGYSETDEVREALRLGAGCYVRKPYGIEKIGKAIKEELNK